MAQYDMVIRSGSVIDGTGQGAFSADVAIKDGLIVEVGKVSGAGAREVDADGALVTPGFVDIHTPLRWPSDLVKSYVTVQSSWCHHCRDGQLRGGFCPWYDRQITIC